MLIVHLPVKSRSTLFVMRPRSPDVQESTRYAQTVHKVQETKTDIAEHNHVPSSFGLRNNPLILSRLDVIQCSLKMPLWILQ